ncbi:MAG: hypothetical protein HXX17_10890 [Geobacteraceae bacterium]|nr:hypothetical protein [Geobacteraceae bacterium]
MKYRVVKALLAVTFMLAVTACDNAPKKEDVAISLKKIMPVNFEVLNVSPVDGISGLYEVLINADKKPLVLYVNSKAKLVVSGSIVNVDSKQNLTAEAVKKITSK